MSRARWGLIAGIVVIGLLQLVWLVWFWVEPLPNARNVGGQVRRGLLLSQAIPEVIPGVSWSESHLGLALEELSHLENLPQRVPMAATGLLIALAALGAGGWILSRSGVRRMLTAWERWGIGFAVGMTLLGLVMLGLGRMGWLNAWVIRAGLVALAVLGVWQEWRAGREVGGADAVASEGVRQWPVVWPWVGVAAITGPFLVMMALGSMLPTIDFDCLEYHLQAPKEYYQSGRITFLPHNVYASMPFGVEMVHLLGMVALGDWWRGALVGQCVVMLHAPFTALLIAAAGSRFGSGRAGWWGAVLYLTTPWVYRLGVVPYVEGPLCLYHAAFVLMVAQFWRAPDGRERAGTALVLGMVAGGAMACKYPALISAVIPAGLAVLVRSVQGQRITHALIFGLGVILMIGPWLVKNVWDTGNPVYPLAAELFGGRDWDAARQAKWQAAHGPKGVSWSDLGSGLIDVAGRSDWQSALYLAFAPLAWLRPGSRKATGWLTAYAVYLFATWFVLTHRIDRFWLPMLPILAMLGGLGADWTRERLWRVAAGVILTLGVATNLTYVSTSLAGLNEWTADLNAMRQRVPALVNSSLARLDRELPPGARILLVGQASVFHMNHPIVYNTVFDHEMIEQLARGRTPEEVGRALRERGIVYVYVDWSEIARHRKPGGYGFTDFVEPAVFERLTAAGVLERRPWPNPNMALYAVLPPGA